MQTSDATQTAPPALDCTQDAVFLDFDGTLVEIAPRPDAVSVPAGLTERLNRLALACDGALALVSGRDLATLAGFLRSFDGVMVGSHGAEARGAALGAPMVAADPRPVQEALREHAAEEGLLFEPKTHGGALHYRTRPEAAAGIAAFVAALSAAHPAFEVQAAKMAFEMRPRGASKDRALAALMRRAPFLGRRPVYLGDDATDEPALGWVQAQGGYGVKIGPGDSVAQYRLAGPAAVLDWLDRARS